MTTMTSIARGRVNHIHMEEAQDNQGVGNGAGVGGNTPCHLAVGSPSMRWLALASSDQPAIKAVVGG
ncbi:hypothetical protein E2562_031295 [Oryza meyeriana var. granulata]|uniref:Uncharacterized protein n=1 Tax=Oryza meyeriana var. granulata TaxID=110450 RepID=A0A6G1C9X0_9ORYZ|nr:hypothetical protein E2562_031295 [Oryza meyeriana var. granulata]